MPFLVCWHLSHCCCFAGSPALVLGSLRLPQSVGPPMLDRELLSLESLSLERAFPRSRWRRFPAQFFSKKTRKEIRCLSVPQIATGCVVSVRASSWRIFPFCGLALTGAAESLPPAVQGPLQASAERCLVIMNMSGTEIALYPPQHLQRNLNLIRSSTLHRMRVKARGPSTSTRLRP